MNLPTIPAIAPSGRPPPPDVPPPFVSDVPAPLLTPGPPVGLAPPDPVVVKGLDRVGTPDCPGVAPEVAVDAAFPLPPLTPESTPWVAVGFALVRVLPFAFGSICTGPRVRVVVGIS